MYVNIFDDHIFVSTHQSIVYGAEATVGECLSMIGAYPMNRTIYLELSGLDRYHTSRFIDAAVERKPTCLTVNVDTTEDADLACRRARNVCCLQITFSDYLLGHDRLDMMFKESLARKERGFSLAVQDMPSASFSDIASMFSLVEQRFKTGLVCALASSRTNSLIPG